MSKDTIYREDAIKAINLRARIPHDVASAHYADMAINAICSVPSANKPRGEWIDIGGYEVCKNCHEVKRFPHWNFCPSCGADMRVEQTELQMERPCDNCQEFDCYGCEYKQIKREGE